MKIPVKFGPHNPTMMEGPARCPLCHRDLHLTSHAASHLVARRVPQVVFECPHDGCGEYFIATYNSKDVTLAGLAPGRPVSTQLSEEFIQLTPRFQPVFDQCMIAKAHGLDQIVGMALRKALEIFLKDWLCAHAATEQDREQIRGEKLWKTVARLKTDNSLGVGSHEVADLARMVGNDETHLERLQQDLDHADLEEMIRILIGRAEVQLRALEYAKRHQSGPKP